MKILHVITGLNDGGAEAVLFRICTNDKRNKHVVISLMDKGKYGRLLQDSGIITYCLNMPRRRLSFEGVTSLWKYLKKERPDVVQTWMYRGNFVGGLIARLAGYKEIFWGIHNSNLEVESSAKTTILISKLCVLLSTWVPKRIISCSKKSAEIHKQMGYCKNKFAVIPNGYDLDQFSPNSEARLRFRDKWKIPDHLPLLGMVARFDSQKDHANLIKALGMLKKSGREFRCALVGTGMNSSNVELVATIQEEDIENRLLLLGRRPDIPEVMNALDIHVLSSYGEAFPNVLAEAMSCGTPCVTTDVGDAALIVGETGWVVPPRDSMALAQAIDGAMNEMKDSPKWSQRKISARKRISNNFHIEQVLEAYNKEWNTNIYSPQ